MKKTRFEEKYKAGHVATYYWSNKDDDKSERDMWQRLIGPRGKETMAPSAS